MKINYSDMTIGQAYERYVDEGVATVCHDDTLSINFSEEDEDTDCD